MKERRYNHPQPACSFLPIFTSLVEWWQSSSLTYIATTPLLHSLLRWSANLTLERECTENEKIEKKDKKVVGVDLLYWLPWIQTPILLTTHLTCWIERGTFEITCSQSLNGSSCFLKYRKNISKKVFRYFSHVIFNYN